MDIASIGMMVIDELNQFESWYYANRKTADENQIIEKKAEALDRIYKAVNGKKLK